MSVMPACHCHLVHLMDLLHLRSPSLDHHRHILASPFHHISSSVSFATMPLIQLFLRSDTPPQDLCARSQSWSTQPPYPTRSPLREHRWISYASVLLDSLLSPCLGIIPLLLLASTPHSLDFVPALTRPVLLRVSYSLSSTPFSFMFALSLCSGLCDYLHLDSMISDGHL
jgi:hypothetical protein